MRPASEQPSITCPACGMTSYNSHDIREGYCGNCHAFTRSGRPKYIFETCEYCADWTRPTDSSGNADYIRHVLQNHLWTAAISVGDRVEFINPPAQWVGLVGTVSLVKDRDVYVNWDNGEPAKEQLRKLRRADAVR